MAITLAQLRARAESLADQPASAASGTPITLAQFNEFVNDGIRTAYNKVVTLHPDFKVTQQATFTLTSPTANSNALPTDFRAARAVKCDPGTTYEDYLPMYSLRGGRLAARRSYRIAGSLLYIEPAHVSRGSYALLYTPIAPTLAADATALDVELEQFQEVIVLHAAVKAKAKMEWDIAETAAQLGAAMTDLTAWASSQRTADPPRIEDVRSGPRRRWWP